MSCLLLSRSGLSPLPNRRHPGLAGMLTPSLTLDLQEQNPFNKSPGGL